MRQSFDSSLPREAALSRMRDGKKPGRKHNHQPRGRAREKQRMTPILRQRLMRELRRKFSEKVAAYWRGDLETHP